MDCFFLQTPPLAEWDPRIHGYPALSLDDLDNLLGISQVSGNGSSPPEDPWDPVLLSCTANVTLEELDGIMSLDGLESSSGNESKVSCPVSVSKVTLEELDRIMSLDGPKGPSGSESKVSQPISFSIPPPSMSNQMPCEAWEPSVREKVVNYSLQLDRIVGLTGSYGVSPLPAHRVGGDIVTPRKRRREADTPPPRSAKKRKFKNPLRKVRSSLTRLRGVFGFQAGHRPTLVQTRE